MHPIHRVALAAVLGVAVVAGLIALTRTLHLGAAATASADTGRAAIARRAHQLDRMEASLHRALARRPPALPEVPVYPPATPGAAPASAASAPPQTVRYVRPPPRIVHVHRAGGEGDDRGEEAELGDD